MAKPTEDHSTRQRILEVSGPLFAARGYDGATVREICEAAGANVASVNYHFGDKSKLYLEVVKQAIKSRTEHIPMDGGLPADSPPEKRLHAFVNAFMRRRFDPKSPSWWGEIIGREMRHPTDIARQLVGKSWQQNRQILISVVKELLGCKASEKDLDNCVSSVIGQILFYFRGHMSRSKSRGCTMTEDEIESLADHIAKFSLGGIAGTRGTKGKRRSGSCKR